MTVYRCKVCDTYVEWLTAKTGRRQFEHFPQEAGSVALGESWVAQTVHYRHGTRVLMAPLSHYSRAAQAEVRRVFVIHNQERCAQAVRRRSASVPAGRHRRGT